MKNKWFFLLLLPLLLWQCKEEKAKYVDQLDGEWNIERSERMHIREDGSLEYFEDIENAGRIEIFEATPPAVTLKEFTMEYTNFEGTPVFLNSLLYTDEGSTRVMMSKVLCDSPFECDIVWTVETNKKNRQVWAAYGGPSTYFYPPDRFDPSLNSSHLKWRLTLRRE